MHFVENMSNSLGLKQNKPYIDESFFPVTPEKYITISSENHQSKQWDHFQEFINLIQPYLNKQDIKIIEVGSNDVKLQKIISLKNATNPNHWSFIIKNSLCHIGPESFLSSLAAYHNVPSISLFSNTTPEYASPNWVKEGYETSEIEVDRSKGHASFSASESPKTINEISAERVISETLDKLNIENDFKKYDVFYIGKLYHNPTIEVIPDFVPRNDFFPNSLINIRLDYHFNTEVLQNFTINKKISLVSDREIDAQKLFSLKGSIDSLFFKVNESSDISYYENLKRAGFKLHLISQEDCDISEVRFKFFDWQVIEEDNLNKKSIDKSNKICDTTRYKSSKMIFSKKGQFSSKLCFDKDIRNYEHQMIIDEKEFWANSNYYKLYNLK